jgi:uncharacterized protein YkwD
MAKRSRYKFSNYRGSKFNWKSILLAACIVGGALLETKKFLYFDNGQGENGWKIGSSTTSVLNAHQPRSLVENRELALILVNRDRQLNGLSPLLEDKLLSQIAQFHAQDMLARNYYAHVTPEGKTPTDRFIALGGKGGVGENIMEMKGATSVQMNYRLIEQFQKSWMYSQGHRTNLLKSEYTRFGYGIVANPITGSVYAVQDFSLPEK